MRSVDSIIVYSSEEDTDIENLCEIIKFNANIEKSQDNLISDSLRWDSDNAVETDTRDKLAILVTDGMYNKARAQAELNLLAEAGLDSVCMIKSYN